MTIYSQLKPSSISLNLHEIIKLHFQHKAEEDQIIQSQPGSQDIPIPQQKEELFSVVNLQIITDHELLPNDFNVSFTQTSNQNVNNTEF
jgi:hypothetical protein